ncbi:hypothetical protein [Phosphitispora fastidiosa]|uniref:hypothetical protein n=1 Tax=Phosphitispora fastidiosa TaxID=2837202 RepID=UPI001E3D3EDD|nr:hypothetical protein [Phosphitispora fastidiosa]MBU7006177.1 hypothetical protein [Phosphitispora fastidiosa]
MSTFTVFFQKDDRGQFDKFLSQFPDSSEIRFSEGLVGGKEFFEFIISISPAMIGAISGVVVALLKSKRLYIKFKNSDTNVEFELDLVGFSIKDSLTAIEKVTKSINDKTCKELLSEVVKIANKS